MGSEDKHAAEDAFLHYLADPGYFAELYANPEAWRSSDEVTYLHLYAQNSTLQLHSAEQLAAIAYDPDSASYLWAAHLHSGMGDESGSNLLVAAGITLAGTQVFDDGGFVTDLQPTLDRIASGQSYPHRNDGGIFMNQEGLLPVKEEGYYREYVHPTPGIRGPGPQRIVIGAEGEIYYTPDHYQTFYALTLGDDNR